eukprot:1559465-Pleurochrysis_carterae.AAC.1
MRSASCAPAPTGPALPSPPRLRACASALPGSGWFLILASHARCATCQPPSPPCAPAQPEAERSRYAREKTGQVASGRRDEAGEAGLVSSNVRHAQ